VAIQELLGRLVEGKSARAPKPMDGPLLVNPNDIEGLADALRRALVMPAFGAFTGGLNIRDRAFATVFGVRAFTAHMLGDGKLYAFTASRCLPD